VLVITPLDSGTGAHIEQLAKAAGVTVIDYDRLTLGGTRGYYVSFDNVKVGTVMGNGLVSCITNWGVQTPNVIVMKGAPTDNNATLFAQGYDSVLAPHFASGEYTDVSNPPGSWDAGVSLSEFQQQDTAHKSINAALTPNDSNAATIIHYLIGQGVKPRTFPTTGQDASRDGLDNILAGYQCGTVYKPIYYEAGATAALAIYLRAGLTPGPPLVNGAVEDTVSKVRVPSVLADPEWVTTANMKETVLKDNFISAAAICVGQYAAACKTSGISG
jgi:D-xylose transport system substrate-binding protein